MEQNQKASVHEAINVGSLASTIEQLVVMATKALISPLHMWMMFQLLERILLLNIVVRVGIGPSPFVHFLV
jgi:hypothetical protein